MWDPKLTCKSIPQGIHCSTGIHLFVKNGKLGFPFPYIFDFAMDSNQILR